ncbi:MAG: histidine phosphatase family protein, partial [Alphaproteobacteria bacterium]|nr:histidine phosphatase family protein [Alphaproteobacteria bacterium]
LPHLEVKPALIVHSQLSRARDTARIINEALNLPMVEDPDLGEMDAGDWEGQPWEVCSALFEDWVDAPGGETVEQFFTRLKRAKNKILMRDDAPALVVSHGGVLRAFGKFYGLETRPAFRNCHLHEFLPNETTPAFPWDVYHYDHEEELVRARAGIYHGTKY